jgi:hypothetical protein
MHHSNVLTTATPTERSELSIETEYMKPAFPWVEFDDPELPLILVVVLRLGKVVFVVDSRYMFPAGIFMHLLMGSS